MASLRIRTRRWTRQEYDRLIETGLLQEDDPIELIEGRLVVAEPQHDAHARAAFELRDPCLKCDHLGVEGGYLRKVLALQRRGRIGKYRLELLEADLGAVVDRRVVLRGIDENLGLKELGLQGITLQGEAQ